jgi:hypothetical protein
MFPYTTKEKVKTAGAMAALIIVGCLLYWPSRFYRHDQRGRRLRAAVSILSARAFLMSIRRGLRANSSAFLTRSRSSFNSDN